VAYDAVKTTLHKIVWNHLEDTTKFNYSPVTWHYYKIINTQSPVHLHDLFKIKQNKYSL